MAFMGMAKGSVLYWELKVAVPKIRGGRTSLRGGSVGGISRVGSIVAIIASAEGEDSDSVVADNEE